MAQEKHNPWESGLKERQEKEAKEKAEREAKEKAEREAREKAEREARERAEAAKPKPQGPSATEFAGMLAAVDDKDAKLAMIKARAGDLFKQGFYRDADDLYTRAIALEPTHQAYSNRSACRCADRDYERALDDAHVCVHKAPKWGKGYSRLGAALYGLSRFAEAVKAYEEGLKVEPGLQALQEGLADTLKRRQLAGGEWVVLVDGSRKIDTNTRDGVQSLAQLHEPLYICSTPNGICAVDQTPLLPQKEKDGPIRQVKIYSEFGTTWRTFNEQYKDNGCKSLNDVVSCCCDGPRMFTAELRKARLQSLMVHDSRSMSCKHENIDKVHCEQVCFQARRDALHPALSACGLHTIECPAPGSVSVWPSHEPAPCAAPGVFQPTHV